MPRLAFEEPLGGPAKRKPTKHRRETSRDNVVVVLKAATFAIVVAFVGAVVLLATAGGEEPRATAPGVPEIETSRVPSSATTPAPPPAIIAPEVRTQTAEIVRTPPPPSTVPSTPSTVPPPSGEDERFAVVGEPCENRGEYAFTERYEPVVCGGQRPNQKLVWRPLFR